MVFTAYKLCKVALFTRAWIEIRILGNICVFDTRVALFTRAWIEIADKMIIEMQKASRPLHEGVD